MCIRDSATAYRYLKSLTESGLLAPTAGGAYVLGSRIIELDRHLRQHCLLYTSRCV